MDRQTLLKKLDAMLQEAQRTNLWGTIEISFQNGSPTMLRKISTEKLIHEGSNPDGRNYETRSR